MYIFPQTSAEKRFFFQKKHCSSQLDTSRKIIRAVWDIKGRTDMQYYIFSPRIHSVNNIGAQPLPMKNNGNLNVSVSPIGFFQNTACISLGHSFNEKNAFPFRSFNNSLRRSDTSFFERRRISWRYILRAAILRVSLLWSKVIVTV